MARSNDQASVRDAILALIATHTDSMDALAASTPKVLDGHSDGKRVRYVRSEVAVQVLRDVLAMLEGGAA